MLVNVCVRKEKVAYQVAYFLSLRSAVVLEAAILLITVVRNIRHCQCGIFPFTCKNFRFKDTTNSSTTMIKNIFFLRRFIKLQIFLPHQNYCIICLLKISIVSCIIFKKKPSK